jgi:hypothetical protein
MSTIIPAHECALAAEIAAIEPLEVQPADAERLREGIRLGVEAVKSGELDGIPRVLALAEVLRLRAALESIDPTA